MEFMSIMRPFYAWYQILKIQKLRRSVSYAGCYCFASISSYAYTNNTTRAGCSRGDQLYASYPARTELLTDTAKVEDWGSIELSIMAKHFERQGKSPYAYHAQYMTQLVLHGQLDGSG